MIGRRVSDICFEMSLYKWNRDNEVTYLIGIDQVYSVSLIDRHHVDFPNRQHRYNIETAQDIRSIRCPLTEGAVETNARFHDFETKHSDRS